MKNTPYRLRPMIHSDKDSATENDTKYIKGRTLLLL